MCLFYVISPSLFFLCYFNVQLIKPSPQTDIYRSQNYRFTESHIEMSNRKLWFFHLHTSCSLTDFRDWSKFMSQFIEMSSVERERRNVHKRIPFHDIGNTRSRSIDCLRYERNGEDLLGRGTGFGRSGDKLNWAHGPRNVEQQIHKAAKPNHAWNARIVHQKCVVKGFYAF